jgi:hypothetical protein
LHTGSSIVLGVAADGVSVADDLMMSALTADGLTRRFGELVARERLKEELERENRELRRVDSHTYLACSHARTTSARAG